MTSNSIVAAAAVIAALLACKGKGEDKDLPDAPPLPSGGQGEDPRESSPPSEPTPEPPGDSSASASKGDEGSSDKGDPGTGDTGAGDKGTGDKGADSDGADDDSGTKGGTDGKDAGTAAPTSVDASVGDLQKRAEQCLNLCSKQFEKCKAVDISKLPECIQKQASCTAGCK